MSYSASVAFVQRRTIAALFTITITYRYQGTYWVVVCVLPCDYYTAKLCPSHSVQEEIGRNESAKGTKDYLKHLINATHWTRQVTPGCIVYYAHKTYSINRLGKITCSTLILHKTNYTNTCSIDTLMCVKATQCTKGKRSRTTRTENNCTSLVAPWSLCQCDSACVKASCKTSCRCCNWTSTYLGITVYS